MWDDGSALGWTHWDKYQPDDGESYVMVQPSHDGLWHEYPETHEAYAVYIMPLGFSANWECNLIHWVFDEGVYCDWYYVQNKKYNEFNEFTVAHYNSYHLLCRRFKLSYSKII